MISTVQILNEQGHTFTLSFWDASNGYAVQDIDGLDPVEAELSSSSSASMDGEEYQAARRGKRNIVIQLGMEPGDTGKSVRDLRAYLYSFFLPKKEVALRFVDADGSLYDIVGIVESFRAPLFAKEPKATISILCFKPDFVNPTTTTFEGASVEDSSVEELTYNGDTKAGFEFEMQIDQEISDLTLSNMFENGVVTQMPIMFDFLAGDILRISTIPGSKSLIVSREGVERSILYALNPTASWVYLEPGINKIQVAVEGDPIPFTIVYNSRFGGL